MPLRTWSLNFSVVYSEFLVIFGSFPETYVALWKIQDVLGYFLEIW